MVIPKKLLIVAEKPSIARSFVRAFSTAHKLKFTTTKGKSRYNPIFETNLETELTFNVRQGEEEEEGEEIRFVAGDKLEVSSVTGHVTTFDYPPPYDKGTSWQESDPLDLVDLDAIELPISQSLVEQIEDLGRSTTHLVVATDWDPQGESIGSQIVRLAQTHNPRLIHSRMRFTSTSTPSLMRSFDQQYPLDNGLVESVDSLRRQDLRMGAALTRFLTVGVQELGYSRLISYGPCQSSVLWIITDRFAERQAFEPEPYWLLQASYTQSATTPKPKKTTKKKNTRKKTTRKKATKKQEGQQEEELSFQFLWDQNPLTSEQTVKEKLELIGGDQTAKVVSQTSEKRVVRRPKPLDTDTLEADGARIFRVSPKLIADLAEKLYNNGIITYPRTESSYYLMSDLTPLCERFLEHPVFKDDAQLCLTEGNPQDPSKGRFTKDHEPISPVKAVTEQEVKGAISGSDFEKSLAWRIYEFIVRRFLATIHQDAETKITTTKVTVGEEPFSHEAETIVKQGFLKVYPFKRITENPVPGKKRSYPVLVTTEQKFTVPPDLWTEGQLIREMARLNIGTDATRSQHIATVVTRGYARVQSGSRSLFPTEIGQAFYEVFTKNAEELILPQIRETVEQWTHEVREGNSTPKRVDEKVKQLTKRSLKNLTSHKEEIFPVLGESIKEATKEGLSFGTCPKCQSDLVLKVSTKGKRRLECADPECKQTYPAPRRGELKLLDEICRSCDSMYPLQVGTGTKSWIFCPHCWVSRSDEEGLMFCSRCEYEDCPYSGVNRNYKTKQEKGRLGTCPNCNEGEVILFFEEWKSIVECENCKTEWKAPNIRAGTSIEIDGPCKLCNLSTLLVKRKGKTAYNMCPICSLLCFQCIHRCYG